jgi:curved DNA-binding protein CbpA
MADYYATLGVDRSDGFVTIRAAYRSLARRSHPDAGGDATAMARLNDAWGILSKPERRASYDAELRAQEEQAARPTATPRRSRDGHTILDFGRYAGWSLADVARADDDYLVWLSRTPTGRPLRREINDLLEMRARAVEAVRPAAPAARRRLWRR